MASDKVKVKVKVEPMEVENSAEKPVNPKQKGGDDKDTKPTIAKPISINELNVANEIYMMAKTNGDAVGAAKCFSNIFSELYCIDDPKTVKSTPSELSAVVNQMKEEIRILLNELKTRHLKLKTLPTPVSLNSRQSTSVNPSPILSPRMRLSSEDKVPGKDSLSKLDSHLSKSTKGIYYQHLFDNLSEEIKKSILEHSIENCYNPFERYRLTMLTLSIFKDKATTYGSRLLKTLIELSDPTEKAEQPKQANPKSSMMCRYAKSLLVLDAIPLILNLTPLSSLEVDVYVLFHKTLNFYSEQCLRTAASDNEISALHDGVKKSIAARIVGIEHESSEDAIEDHLVFTFNLLSQKLLETITDDDIRLKLEEIRAIVTDRTGFGTKFVDLLEVVKGLDLKDDIPDDILFNICKEDQEARPVVTPPPKSRSRPKKQTTPTSLDESGKKQLQTKAREIQFVFFSIVQYLFFNCASYLRGTRSRILLNFSNPLAEQIKSEIIKGSSQRSSRSKSGSQQSNTSNSNPAKKPKLENQQELSEAAKTLLAISPLDSAESRKIDLYILNDLSEVKECLEILNNSEYVSIKKLWQNFVTANSLTTIDWFRRISIDSKFISGHHDQAIEMITEDETAEQEKSDIKSELMMSNTAASPTITVAHLRGLVQQISCHIQLVDKTQTLSKIDELIAKLKQSGLATNDDSITSENIIDEYMVTVQHDKYDNLGFLFFDSMSMFRYVVDILMDMLQRHVVSATNVSDTVLGHTIVLSQFDWPKEGQIYNHCIDWLRANKPKSATPQCLSASTKFTYNDFFQYIRNPNIIEDFMALLSQGYTLEIKGNGQGLSQTNQGTRSGALQQTPTKGATGGSTTRSGKAITTRGVNKTFKEDLKLALVAQMRNSSTFMPVDLISEFIQTCLLPYLISTKK